MTSKDSLGNIFVGVLALCAMTTTGLFVHREFFARSSGVFHPDTKPTQVKDWPAIAATGERMGPADAAVTIVEFADFQCPACRHFTLQALEPVRRQYPNDVAVVFRHLPLPYHKAAYPAARAAECAAKQGRFEAIHDAFYQHQDSIEIRSMMEFGRMAGIRDTMAFAGCLAEPTPVSAVVADTIAARAVAAGGTPTVIINGLKFPLVPDSTRLDSLVRVALVQARHR